MVRNIGGKELLLGPQDKGLAFTAPINYLLTLSVGETIQLDGMSIRGIKTTHGELVLKIGPFSKTIKPGPSEQVGWGAIGFKIKLDGKTIVNLGDTIIHKDEWKTIKNPDVLMIPIGGRAIHNTMGEKEALQAIEIMHPKLVIPCYYNCPAFFTKKYHPADDEMFKHEVEKLGITCHIMHYGDVIKV